VFIYNSPALNGDLGLEKIRGQCYYIEDKYASLPSILNSFDPSYSHYRVLFLPWEYSTLLKVESEVPNYFGMPLGGGVTANTNWLKDTLTLATAKDSPDRSSLLGLFGVKYIVIDQTFGKQNYAEDSNVMSFSGVYESYDSYWVAGPASYFYSLFKDDSNFSLKFQNSDFIIFENKKASNLIYSRMSDIQLAFMDVYS